MKLNKSILLLFFALALLVVPTKNVLAGVSGHEFEIPVSDNDLNITIFSFFDLRERETFIQATVTANSPSTLHIQIFNVADNCNENNFFDLYTGNDTHIYNMRNILTNDGNPSGVVLPDNAYGIVVIGNFDVEAGQNTSGNLIGNFRIIDNAGYEYRTNSQAWPNDGPGGNPDNVVTFNFNTIGGVTLSDIVAITVANQGSNPIADDITDIFVSYDVDIYNNNEVPFSCRDVTFACVDDDNPLLEELLEESGTSVASFEYGINKAIPHSRGGELLCPGNTISEGFVRMDLQGLGEEIGQKFFYVGLNSGNGKGSMDAVWETNDIFPPPPCTKCS